MRSAPALSLSSVSGPARPLSRPRRVRRSAAAEPIRSGSAGAGPPDRARRARLPNRRAGEGTGVGGPAGESLQPSARSTGRTPEELLSPRRCLLPGSFPGQRARRPLELDRVHSQVNSLPTSGIIASLGHGSGRARVAGRPGQHGAASPGGAVKSTEDSVTEPRRAWETARAGVEAPTK
jgi:hypothetical protein